MDQPEPIALREQGRLVLEGALAPFGFRFIEGEASPGSGGKFARGSFVCGDRRLEFSVRVSLGMVVYHFGSDSISHSELMRAALRSGSGHKYPGFSSVPLDAFRALAEDLTSHLRAFLDGDRETFRELIRWAERHPKRRGLAGLESGGTA